MEGKKTQGRQNIEMKKIENVDDRLVTFSKRRSGIYKKANELATLCGAEVGVVVFSPSGKPFSYGNPSLDLVTNRLQNDQQQPAAPHYQNQNQNQYENDDDDTDRTYPILEAYRQLRTDEIIKQHNVLVSELEAEREREKVLQLRMKPKAKEASSSLSTEAAGNETGTSSSSSSSQLQGQPEQGWWEALVEELDLQGLKQLHASFQYLHNGLSCFNLRPH